MTSPASPVQPRGTTVRFHHAMRCSFANLSLSILQAQIPMTRWHLFHWIRDIGAAPTLAEILESATSQTRATGDLKDHAHLDTRVPVSIHMRVIRNTIDHNPSQKTVFAGSRAHVSLTLEMKFSRRG